MKKILLILLIMNIFNLFGQSKPKSDPYGEFDQSKHFRPRLEKGEFFKLSGFDFGWFVLEPISDYIQDLDNEVTRGKTLSYGQKALYYWWYLDAQVTNGGFTQFYFNGYGKYVPTIIKALEHIGDHEMADLVNQSYRVYLREREKIEAARTGDWEDFSELYEELEDMDPMDSEYYDLNDNTMKLIEKYIRTHPNEICVDEDGKEFNMQFSGDLTTYYDSQKLKEIIPLTNGLVNGTFRSYYENQNLKEAIKFVNGEHTGERYEYYENGNKKYTICLNSSKNQLEHQSYYENGNLQKLEHRQLHQDKRIGEYKEWYDNGQLAESGTYIKDMERDGPWLEYHKNGTKKLDAEFKDGNFLIHNCWNEKGEQILTNGTGFYINEYCIFDGEVNRNEQHYKDYKRDGKQQSFTNERLTLSQEMSKGKEHGITRSYDENGNLKEEVVYENGVEISRKEFKNK